jgi:hypothetical protein
MILKSYIFFFSGGVHMFTPSSTKREQMRKQAEDEQHRYEAHIEQTRLRNINEVHRLGRIDLF